MPGPQNLLHTPFCRDLGIEYPILSVGTPPPDFDGDVEYAPLCAGESVCRQRVKPAAEIVRDLVAEAERVLAGD